MDNMLEIGQVVNTHGVRGELKIMPWCDDPAIYDELEYFYIDGRRYNIKRTRLHKNCEIVAVEGIDNINDAELLKNKIVTVEREALGELPEGTYYIADLLGLEVKTVEGRVLGKIFDVIRTGSNDVYHIKSEGKNFTWRYFLKFFSCFFGIFTFFTGRHYDIRIVFCFFRFITNNGYTIFGNHLFCFFTLVFP